jgi:hypothetical protein
MAGKSAVIKAYLIDLLLAYIQPFLALLGYHVNRQRDRQPEPSNLPSGTELKNDVKILSKITVC